jgi:four helix bundle protein
MEGFKIEASTGKRDVKTFKDLLIWQQGMRLAEGIYHETERFPKSELYGMVSQMRRAAVSVPSNIAEGYRRRHAREFQQFLSIALGSLGELETQVILAHGFQYLPLENQNHFLEAIDSLVRMIVGYSKKICP